MKPCSNTLKKPTQGVSRHEGQGWQAPGEQIFSLTEPLTSLGCLSKPKQGISLGSILTPQGEDRIWQQQQVNE